MEGQAENLDVEVNGVASEVAFGPAPVTVFDDEAGIGGQNKIAGLAGDELESVLLQQRHQRREPGGADLGWRRLWRRRKRPMNPSPPSWFYSCLAGAVRSGG